MSFINISGNGTIINLVASFTFPAGIVLTAFADDADPIDLPTVQMGDAAKGLNADMVAWSTPNVIPATINIIPGSPDDRLLNILLQANTPGKFKFNSRDRISAAIYYPNGSFSFLSDGIITSGMVANSVASSARLKTKPYEFKFGEFSGA